MKKSLYLAIAFSLILIIPSACKEKLPRPDISKPKNLVEPENHSYSFENPPVFKKEGELRFVDKNTRDLISEIDIEIADTNFDRALGLMFRPVMQEDRGMLFKFGEEEIQSFWMRNTIISLDILYVNSKGEIVSIYKNTETQSDKSMPSDKPAIYVVEVNAGYCDSLGIEIGDYVEF